MTSGVLKKLGYWLMIGGISAIVFMLFIHYTTHFHMSRDLFKLCITAFAVGAAVWAGLTVRDAAAVGRWYKR
jgi:hypothetical protein